MASPIVVGIDFSAESRHALDAAIQVAKDMGTSLVLVHAFRPLGATEGIAGGQLQRDLRQERARAEEDEAVDLTTQWAQRVRDAGVEADVVAQEEETPQLILGTAREREAALIVVGTHGRTGLRRVLLGSVAEAVVRGSDRPVLVVPGPEA